MKHIRTIKDLPAEHQALIHIISNDDSGKISYQNLDPDKLVALAEKHRLTPILYNYLSHRPHDFSQQLMDHIKELTREHTIRSLNLQAELFKIFREFDRQHISYITIKGPQLSHFLYNDGSRRVCVDLDLFLQYRHQFSSASAILHESGYLRTNFPENSGRMKQRIFNAGKHESFFVNRSTRTVIDLHIRPVGNTMFSAGFHRHFFSEKQTYDMNGRLVFVPSVIHYFIFLCHHGAVHGYASLHWLADICAFYQKYPVQPEELMKVSETLKLKRHILLSLLILHRYCGIDISRRIPDITEKSRTIRKLFGRFHHNITREKSYIHTIRGRIEKTMYRLMLAEGFLSKADVILSIFARYFYRIVRMGQ